MKNKIAKIIKECIDDYYRVAMKNEYQVVEEILDLINLEKAKENCYQKDKMRLNGWLHKDDPVKGLKVVRSCEHKNYNCAYDCKLKLDTCIEESGVPLTVGEALEMFEGVVNIIQKQITNCFPDGPCGCQDVLTTKDGGRIVKEEG